MQISRKALSVTMSTRNRSSITTLAHHPLARRRNSARSAHGHPYAVASDQGPSSTGQALSCGFTPSGVREDAVLADNARRDVADLVMVVN